MLVSDTKFKLLKSVQGFVPRANSARCGTGILPLFNLNIEFRRSSLSCLGLFTDFYKKYSSAEVDIYIMFKKWA